MSSLNHACNAAYIQSKRELQNLMWKPAASEILCEAVPDLPGDPNDQTTPLSCLVQRCKKMPSSGLSLIACLGDRFLSSTGTGKNCALSMRLSNPSPVLDKNRAPMVQEFYTGLGLGSGGRLLRHFQTPVLYWINFSLRLSVSRVSNSYVRHDVPFQVSHALTV